MFEAEVFGVDVGVPHLVAVIVGLAIGTSYLLVRVGRLRPVATMAVSLLITQVLAGAVSAVLLRLSEQPVHDAQTWVAHQVAVFDAVVFWLLGPVFTVPAIGLVVLSSRRRGVRSTGLTGNDEAASPVPDSGRSVASRGSADPSTG